LPPTLGEVLRRRIVTNHAPAIGSFRNRDLCHSSRSIAKKKRQTGELQHSISSLQLPPFLPKSAIECDDLVWVVRAVHHQVSDSAEQIALGIGPQLNRYVVDEFNNRPVLQHARVTGHRWSI
jgi:hypothetical protein